VPETRRGSRDQVRAGKAARAMEKGSAGISSCHLQATEYTPERAPGALQASRLGLALMNLTARTDIIECPRQRRGCSKMPRSGLASCNR
jgi:hypothetical protein